jgi:hypothetical protein
MPGDNGQLHFYDKTALLLGVSRVIVLRLCQHTEDISKRGTVGDNQH